MLHGSFFMLSVICWESRFFVMLSVIFLYAACDIFVILNVLLLSVLKIFVMLIVTFLLC